jgi:hypothetical protein
MTIPRLLLILVLSLGYFFLHLDMKEKMYPLHHIMFALNNLLIYLAICGAVKMESMLLSTLLLIIFVAAGFFFTLMLKIKWIYRFTLASNVLILYELYIETIDYFDSYRQFLVFILVLLIV